MLPVEL